MTTWTGRNINWRFIKLLLTIHSSLYLTNQPIVTFILNTSLILPRLRSYPTSSSLSRETIRSLVFYALRVWADPTPLEFHEVSLFPWMC